MTIKRTIVTAILFISLTLQIQAQSIEGITHSGHRTGQLPFPLNSYLELQNPIATNLSDWKNVSKTNISWGSVDIRYKKEVPPSIPNSRKSVSVTGWRGERVSTQFVVWSNKPLGRLSFFISDLKHKNKKDIIPSSQLHSGFVRYVMTDELNKDGKGGCGHRPNLSIYDSTLVADPIDHLTKELSLTANSTQGVWVQTRIPQNASSGTYKGKITVMNGTETLGVLELNIEVSNRKLPQPKEWDFFLDLWQNPFAIARYYNVELWSDAHFEKMKPYMEMYRDAGGKTITASIMHKPWNAQTFDYFETMVTWMKKADGTWSFDYTVFDRWVEFMLNLGVNKSIMCYSMVPWKLSFQYFDQATNSLKFIDMKPGDKTYQEVWGAMLASFSTHLKEKGWFDITYISMDERPMNVMQETIKIIKKANSDFKISLAGALHEELSDDMDYYCVALRMKYPQEMKDKRASENKITTYYTSCEEPYPNTFTFSPPAECEWFGWYAAKENLDGYLRWAYNSWVLEPLLDSRFHTWAAGDTYFVYPGARTSMRFERLISGIQAYEKIKILRDEFISSGNKRALSKITEALNLFDEKTLDKVPASDAINKANRIINKL
ncbi:MAG: DUF6067 family protein [Bacteroidia bacterium]|nr:DUF6067 family protein [Bacteroidia bacterium]